MKKSPVRQIAPSGGDKSPRPSSNSQPLEKAKTDTANIQSPHGRKNSKDDKTVLTKNLSKSHDNLASILRKKAAAATLAGNKENIKDRVLSPAPVTFKTPKAGAPIRKAQSTHNIDNSGTPIKRAQSAQNISKASSNNREKSVAKAAAVKRASSTQNVNKSPSRQRLSIPVNSMAHNAELLATFEKERRSYEAKISELIQCSESRKVELEKKKFMLNRYAEDSRRTQQENRLYKDKLQELGVTVEQLTDPDKLQLIHRREDSYKTNCATGVDAHAGSTRASSVPRDGSEGDVLSQNLGCAGSERALSIGDVSCITPEHPSSLSFDNWDTKSNKSSDATSEISVACLQDRISQMEETHYSTNEELEATRLELADLQDTVNDLTFENETLSEDKSVLLESLCTQTEKLENCRLQIDHLKTLLVGDGSTRGWSLSEKQLVDLIKSGQQEKEELLLREKELCNQLHLAETNIREHQDEISALRDASQIQTLKMEGFASEKRVIEAQLTDLKEQCAKDHIEMARYRKLFDNERQRVTELEQERNATNKSDLEELLDSTRTEKDRLEKKLANAQEELAVANNDLSKLRDTVESLEDQLLVCKNNAKTEVADLEHRLECADREKQELQAEADQLREHVDQLQLDCDRYLTEKRDLQSTIAQLESDLRTIRSAEQELDKKIRDEVQKFNQEKQDWEQFQMDLQLAVKVAADFKTEAQEDMERLQAERHYYRHRAEELEGEVNRLTSDVEKYRSQQQDSEADIIKRKLRGTMMCTVDRELAALRQGQKMSDSRGTSSSTAKDNISVKHLIATIEQQVKSDRSTPPVSPSITSQESNSRRNSTDSTLSLSSMSEAASPKVVLDRRTSHPTDTPLKGVLRRTPESKVSDVRSPIGHRHTITNIIIEKEDATKAASPTSSKQPSTDVTDSAGKKGLTGILSNKSSIRKSSLSSDPDNKPDKSPYPYSGVQGLKTDPLAILAKQMGGSKRNALLKWCQHKLATYPGIDITNFSSSWNDGLAFCALLHSYLPDQIPYKQLNSQDKVRNFTLAFNAAKGEGITTHLNINDMAAIERPDWQAVMAYVANIYKHFEIDSKS